MPAFKGINTESDPHLHFSNVRRHTDSMIVSHLVLVDDDIDTCTMEEARNLNVCRTDDGGASELQHKIL